MPGQQVHGIGFLLADRLAGQIGMRGDFPLRVQAGVLHVLRESSERGHCYLPLGVLAKSASQLLEVDAERIDIAVEKLAARGDLVLQSERDPHVTRVYLASLCAAEQRVRASALPTLDHAVVSPRRTAAPTLGKSCGR
jgi:exodeoxyribonuclease V alpha subunit